MRLAVIGYSGESISVFFTPLASSSHKGFVKNLPLSLILRASVFIFKKLAAAKHYFLIAPETRSHLTGSDTA
jgi:hypothetical protein